MKKFLLVFAVLVFVAAMTKHQKNVTEQIRYSLKQ